MVRGAQAREQAAAAYLDGMMRFGMLIALLPNTPDNGRVRERLIFDKNAFTWSFLSELKLLTTVHGMATIRNSALFNDELKSVGVAARLVAQLLAEYREAQAEDFTKLVAEYPKGFRDELFDYIRRHQ